MSQTDKMIDAHLFKKKSSKPSAGRSFFSWFTVFNTDGLVSPLLRSTQLFLRIIAGTFAIYKLLPKNYPGLHDASVSMSLHSILLDAWKNVRLTREGALQASLFFAVLAIIVGGVVFLFSALFSAFTGVAHAQSIFVPEDPDEDVAQNWLNYLFVDGGTLPTFNNFINETLTDYGLLASFRVLLGFYSGAILIVAALMMFYYLVIMVLETAHKGVPLGNTARQIWAPLRLVIAIGLLVPINDELNSGQYIVIKMASWGSGLASNAWKLFVDQVTLNMAPGEASMPKTDDIVKNMVANYACVIDYNHRIDHLVDISIRAEILDTVGLMDKQIDLNPAGEEATISGTEGTKYLFAAETGMLSEIEMCGWYFLRDEENARTGASAQRQNAVFNSFIAPGGGFYTFATNIDQFIPVAQGGTKELTRASYDEVQLAEDYDDLVQSYADGVKQAALESMAEEPVSEEVAETLGHYGWVFAGAFFTTIERMQIISYEATTGGMPVVQGPTNPYNGASSPTINNKYDKTVEDTAQEVFSDLDRFMRAVSSGNSSASGGGSVSLTDLQCAGMLGVGSASSDYWAVLTNLGGSLMDLILAAVDYLAYFFGLWGYGTGASACSPGSAGTGLDTFKLGVNLSQGVDALQALAAWGHANISVGYNLAGFGIMAYVGGGLIAGAAGVIGGTVVAGAGLGTIIGGLIGMKAGAFLGTILEFFAMIFLALGFTFAFILPMVPFTRFFFGVVIWIGELIETVIAVPIIALAQLNPEGEGLVGDARQAYFYIFSLFLRPILTVFGLIAGFMIFLVASTFLTYSYTVAVADTGSMAYGHEVISKIVYTIIYVYMMYGCANKAFEMITHIPNGVLAFMAKSDPRVADLSSIEQFKTGEQLAGAYVTKEGISNISKLGKGAGSALGGSTTPPGTGPSGGGSSGTP